MKTEKYGYQQEKTQNATIKLVIFDDTQEKCDGLLYVIYPLIC